MPLAIDPNKRFTIVLKSDSDKPKEAQPKFFYRYLTGRQWLKVAAFRDLLEDIETAQDVSDQTYASAATGLVGWENIIDPETNKVIEFGIDSLPDIVGITEAQELIIRLMSQAPTIDDKKKSEPQPQSDSGKSAKIAQG